MIDQEKRKAVYSLHKEGMSLRGISLQLKVSRNTVRDIIKQEGAAPKSTRKDKRLVDAELLTRLYAECEGWIQRVHEKLMEEEKIQVGYSTLTRLIRDLGLGQPDSLRCNRVPDEPGAEMQHDTSPYVLKIGGKQTRVVGSLLYFRYSKRRYLKFYRTFDRFKMKCFFHAALTFFSCTAPVCIIDNTNLARLRGTGKNAVIVPEMEQFARQYGFRFVCHEVGHCNRKAGNERSFWTVETNFFPGRNFESLEDLNRQALDWATVRMVNRPVSKSGLIPAKAFEHEQAYLIKLPSFVEQPYLPHKRETDQYGYAAFAGNYYWVPGTKREEATILEFSQSIKIYCRRELLVEYQLPPEGVKNQSFFPADQPKPKYTPKSRRRPTTEEEQKLRKAPEVDAYLNFALKPKGIQKHQFIRELFSLQQKIALPLFIAAIKRALKYRITEIQTIERIAMIQMTGGDYELPQAEVDPRLQARDSYLEGRFGEEIDLSQYDKMWEDEENG